MAYHDSHPIHHIAKGVGLKREGNQIILYPGDPDGTVRLTLSEWASAVAFTSLEGESGTLHRAILGLLGESG